MYFNSVGGTALEVGSVKVNTINLARLAYESDTTEQYLTTLKDKTVLCLKALDCVRHIIKRNTDKGLLPNYSKNVMSMDSQYNTIGIIGVYEALAKFERVSYEQFRKECKKLGYFPYEDVILSAYNNIRSPERATACSAGYDFFAPLDIQLPQRHAVTIPTGIKCKMDEGWVLQMCPRSGYGIKYGLRLANTVGIIDGDYYGNVGNEGHILIKLINDAPFTKGLNISAGTAFCQGIFLPFGITTDDKASAERKGGFGSTSLDEQGGI